MMTCPLIREPIDFVLCYPFNCSTAIGSKCKLVFLTGARCCTLYCPLLFFNQNFFLLLSVTYFYKTYSLLSLIKPIRMMNLDGYNDIPTKCIKPMVSADHTHAQSKSLPSQAICASLKKQSTALGVTVKIFLSDVHL